MVVSIMLALTTAYRSGGASDIGTAGASVREFSIPTLNGFPHDAAVDRDGRVYFTEIEANKIG
ncbi:MAG TPA: hypothetical protein VMD75_14725, partial [Candidatus Binataceae bacterium]|nr:hypothetical protein [Candidatus Binataceae bacterium]